MLLLLLRGASAPPSAPAAIPIDEYLLLLRRPGGGGTPVVLATSLLGAIRAFWRDNGLATIVCPLYTQVAPPGATYPFIVIGGIREVLPGETPEDLPVEMFPTVYAATAAQARAKGKAAQDWLDATVLDIRGVPTLNPNRPTSLAWTGGAENSNERDEDVPSDAGLKQIGRVFAYRIHYRWWVRGRP